MNEFDGENQDDAFYQSSGSAYREEVVPRSRGQEPKPITSRDIVEMFGGSGASLPTPKPSPAPVAQPVARDKPITSQDIVAMFAGSPADEVVEQPKPPKEKSLLDRVSGVVDTAISDAYGDNKPKEGQIDKAALAEYKIEQAEKAAKIAATRANMGLGKDDAYATKLLTSAAGGLGAAVSSTIEWIGEQAGSDSLKKIGEAGASFSAALTPEDQDLVQKVAGGVGSMLSFAVPGLGVAKGLRLLGMGVKGARSVASGVAATLESASVAQETYEKVMSETGNKDLANEQSWKAAIINLPFTYFTNKLGVFGDSGSAAKKIGTAFLMEGPVQEGGQNILTNVLGFKPAGEGYTEESLVGGIAGGGFKGGMMAVQKWYESASPKEREDVVKQIIDDGKVAREQVFEAMMQDERTAKILTDAGITSAEDENFLKVAQVIGRFDRELSDFDNQEKRKATTRESKADVDEAFRDTASTGFGVGMGSSSQPVIKRSSVTVDEESKTLVPKSEAGPEFATVKNERGEEVPATAPEDIVAYQQGFAPLPGVRIGTTPWANRFLNARQAQANIDLLETGNELEAKLEAHRQSGNVFDKEALSAARTQLNDLRVRFGLPRITKWKQPIQPIFPDLSAQDVQIRQGKRSKEAGGGDFFFLEARPLPDGAVKPERVQTKTPAPATPATPAAPASTVGVPGASQTTSGQAPTTPQPGATASTTPSTPVSTMPSIVPSTPASTMPTAPVSTEAAAQPTTGTDAAPSGIVLQNRNRATPASVAQMTSIGSQPDYGRLGFSRDFANGAPVVFGGSIPESQMGKKDYAVAQDGRKIDIRYAVVEADQVLASNRADGTPNPAYGNPEVEGIRAVAGNGRIAGLQNAYENDRAAAYKQELAKDDLHGVSEKVIVGMDRPVLVRVMSAKDLTQDIGDVSNIAAGLGLSAVEQAKNDANRVNLEDLTFTEDGRASNKTVTEFVRSMPASEQGTLIDTNGIPTTQAVDRLNAAIFSGAYQNDELVRLYAQAQDPEARLVLSSLAQIAPKMVRLQGAGDLDFRAAVATAAEAVVNGKRLGLTLDEIARQRDITVSDPAVTDILELFARNPKSVKPVVRALSRAADVALQEANKPAQDMFGATPKMSRQDIIGNLKQFETDQAGLDLRRVIADGFETIEDLNKKAQSLLDPTKGEVFRAVRVPVGDLVGKVPGLGLIQKSASLFGKEVVFFRVEEGKNIFDGAVIRGGNKIFVNVTSTKPHLRIVGHEMVHALRRSNPAAYDRLVNSLQPMLDQKGFASYTELLKSEGMKTADKILEEAIGDIVGDRFGESEFWQMMADRNPTGFKQFAREIIAFIDNILKKIGVNTLGSETLVKDLKSARAEIVRILSDVGQETQAAGQGIDLSRSRDNRDTTSIMSSSKEDARMALGLGAKKNVVRRIAEALNQRTIDAGLAIDRKNYSDAAVEALGESLFNEVAFHLQTDKSENGTGLGWYSYNYPRALDLLSERFPELKKNAAARNLFTALVAITSNGEKVTLNVANAIRLYEAYRNGGRFQDAEIGVKRKQALKANMAELEKLIDAHGLDGLRGYLLKEITVAEMNATLRAMGEKSDGSYKADTIVPTAAIHFGPKLGAFYANLSGSEGYLTMDMWWTRTMNRLRGLLIPKATPQSLARLKELVGDPKLSRDELLDIAVDAAQRYEDHGYWTALEWATGSKEPGKKGPKLVWMEQAKKAAGPAFDAMLQEHNIEKASNTIYKREFKALQEAPFNASDREFMYKVAKYAQDKLKKEGKDLSIADIQAAIWYYEKRLYEKLSGRTADDIGYEEALAGQAAGYRPERPSIRFSGATDGGQGPGRGVPAPVGTRQEDSGGARKKPAEVTQQTPPEGGVSVSDISLSRAREAREIAPIAGQENSGTTQVATTAGSYKKAARAILDAAPDAANVLDYGAGLGIGTDALREVFGDRVTVESYEPFPQRWAGDRPVDYTRSNEIPGKYDAVVNLNVLNVLEPGLRDQVARDIADKLAPGGVAVIGTRKWMGDISTAKNVEKAAEDKAVYVVRRAGGEDVRVYQKGFDGRELVDYLSGLLGDGFTVSQGSGIAANTAIIQRQSADQDISLSRARPVNEGREYESRLFGGAYDAARLRTSAKDAPIRAMINQARERYNAIRVERGLDPVTDWTQRPAELLDSPDISLSRARVAEAVSSASVPGPFAQAVRDRIASAILPSGEQRFNWWHKSIGTQLEKARVNPYFRKVYDLGQKFLDDTAMFAMRAQAAAPTILPNLGNMGIRFWKGGISKANNELLGKMLAEGTLLNGPSPMNGKIWTDAELRSRYNATDEQIKLYREARAAIDQSLDDTTKALMGQLARSGGIPQSAIDPLMEAQLPLSAVRDRLVKALQALPSTGKVQTAINGVKKMASETEAMKKGGYAPLMRFGEFVVSVENAKGEVEYFSLHETAADALRTRNEVLKQFKGPGLKVSNPGARLNSARFKMFAGLSPSTLEAFFNAVPVTSKAEENLRQEYLQLVVSNRSALARMIQRKGTAGYTLDATRTLASFITSNARHSSKALNMAEISRAITQIPAEQGDVAEEAVKLQEYLQNPQEGVPGIRGFLFFNFLGGSIAAGLVNMTQPVLMTYPYLTQWGAGRASSAMSKAMKDATAHLLKKPTGNKALDAALKKAAERGITQPQEMFQLIAAAESGTSSLLGHKFMRVWGLNFAVSEVFNRVVTFTAAFNLGSTLSQAELQKAGVKDAFEFAVRTVEDTQGKYNKGNRPNWARETGVLGSAGTLMFTFKQYSIAYMEFLKQLYKNNKNGKKALGIALGTLILAAGLSGLPGADDLDDLIDTVGNWMGYPTNSKKWKVKFLTETLGMSTQAANFLLYGISSFLPMDLQARLGLANLIPGTGLLNPTRDNKAREVLDVIGPLGGFAANAADAVEMTAKGNFRGAGMKLAPKAVKDAYQGFEMATTGVVRDEKGRTIQEATATEALVKGIGFNPQSVASEGRVQRMIQADIDIVKSKKEELHEQMARAIVDRDEDLKDKVLDELSRWNSGDPEYRIKLDTKAIQARVKKMIIDRSQRFAQQAPKDMRARIIRDLQEQKDARN